MQDMVEGDLTLGQPDDKTPDFLNGPPDQTWYGFAGLFLGDLSFACALTPAIRA
ncbi:hypothetical protein AA0521_2903 [Komagataeibacter intermedius NRIC 0521]|uniref:Uncharacterized protein n=1 Tax=Komagataeibacter intermedius NRIC 0521 TaxID=1307934 RepID=A0ABQ0PNB3_9PROT|nr:hypothetical protein AA0521_2903 [Komagataeibacter intermedius NRIC 0521]